MIVIDGENSVLGRLSTEVAQKALNGEQIHIINAEKVIITGNPVRIAQKYKQRRKIKDSAKPEKSPKLPRRPDLFVKKSIRGMLPRKTKRGAQAYRRIKAHIGTPANLEKTEKIKTAQHKESRTKNITVLELCKQLGWTGAEYLYEYNLI